MKELQPNILDDYEHLVTNAIKMYGNEADFPVMKGFGRKELDDYLFEYQRILDSQGSQKAQLTKYGIIAVIPIIIISAFPENMLPWGKYSLEAGVLIGVLIALLFKGLSVMIVKARLQKLRASNADIAQYAAEVITYHKKKLAL